MLIFPGQSTAAQYNSEGITATLPQSQTTYVFDAVIRNEHEQRVTKTQHPIQTGASISDHAYIEPARLTLEIGMSDAMDSYSQGLWVGSSTKSVSAYQILLAMMFARIPLIVNTKLRNYQNMVIENLAAEDTAETFASLNARVTFSEIFVANIQVVVQSARPQDTNSTAQGTKNPTSPTASQVSQNQVPANISQTLPQADHVVGAGNWSSVNTSNLPQLAP
jgi:hypothetical protein